MAVDDTCPVCRTAEIVCGKWTLLLVRDLAEGRSRFCELERSLAGISPRTLSLRLRALEEEGIVERHTFPEVPPRVEYALTEKGRALLPIIDDMRAYGEDWLGRLRRVRRRARAPDALAARLAPRRPLQPRCKRALRRAGARAARAKSAHDALRQLQTALTDFLDAAAALLHAEVAAGAEVPFELEQQPARRGGRGPPLYCYRPLTAEFIAERGPALERLPRPRRGGRRSRAFDGLDRYLASVGARRRARDAARSASVRSGQRAARGRVRRADATSSCARSASRRR